MEIELDYDECEDFFAMEGSSDKENDNSGDQSGQKYKIYSNAGFRDEQDFKNQKVKSESHDFSTNNDPRRSQDGDESAEEGEICFDIHNKSLDEKTQKIKCENPDSAHSSDAESDSLESLQEARLKVEMELYNELNTAEYEVEKNDGPQKSQDGDASAEEGELCFDIHNRNSDEKTQKMKLENPDSPHSSDAESGSQKSLQETRLKELEMGLYNELTAECEAKKQNGPQNLQDSYESADEDEGKIYFDIHDESLNAKSQKIKLKNPNSLLSDAKNDSQKPLQEAKLKEVEMELYNELLTAEFEAKEAQKQRKIKLEELEKEAEELRKLVALQDSEIKKLSKENQNLKKNISSLYKTAKSEIEHKDLMLNSAIQKLDRAVGLTDIKLIREAIMQSVLPSKENWKSIDQPKSDRKRHHSEHDNERRSSKSRQKESETKSYKRPHNDSDDKEHQTKYFRSDLRDRSNYRSQYDKRDNHGSSKRDERSHSSEHNVKSHSSRIDRDVSRKSKESEPRRRRRSHSWELRDDGKSHSSVKNSRKDLDPKSHKNSKESADKKRKSSNSMQNVNASSSSKEDARRKDHSEKNCKPAIPNHRNSEVSKNIESSATHCENLAKKDSLSVKSSTKVITSQNKDKVLETSCRENKSDSRIGCTVDTSSCSNTATETKKSDLDSNSVVKRTAQKTIPTKTTTPKTESKSSPLTDKKFDVNGFSLFSDSPEQSIKTTSQVASENKFVQTDACDVKDVEPEQGVVSTTTKSSADMSSNSKTSKICSLKTSCVQTDISCIKSTNSEVVSLVTANCSLPFEPLNEHVHDAKESIDLKLDNNAKLLHALPKQLMKSFKEYEKSQATELNKLKLASMKYLTKCKENANSDLNAPKENKTQSLGENSSKCDLKMKDKISRKQQMEKIARNIDLSSCKTLYSRRQMILMHKDMQELDSSDDSNKVYDTEMFWSSEKPSSNVVEGKKPPTCLRR